VGAEFRREPAALKRPQNEEPLPVVRDCVLLRVDAGIVRTRAVGEPAAGLPVVSSGATSVPVDRSQHLRLSLQARDPADQRDRL
jgi:hypothetical protein